MKKLNLILTVILILVMTSPVLAAPGEPVGEYLDFIAHYQEFPADTPFYMQNGYKLVRDLLKDYGLALGDLGFELVIDGEIVPASYWERYYEKEDGIFFAYALFTHNFPQGLPTGTYKIVGNWFIPCSTALEAGLTDECEHPNADFVWNAYNMTVKFTK